MGSGFLEPVYQECLQIEFGLQAIPFYQKRGLDLRYKSQQLEQLYIPDFVCFDQIIVEIKAVDTLCDAHRAQVINYLHVTGFRLGLLVNFGAHPKLEYERIRGVMAARRVTEKVAHELARITRIRTGAEADSP
jgi:GxxExxY protein